MRAFGIVIANEAQRKNVLGRLAEMAIPKEGLLVEFSAYEPKQTSKQRAYLEKTIRRAAYNAGCIDEHEVRQWREGLLARLEGGKIVVIGGTQIWRRNTTTEHKRKDFSILIDRVEAYLGERGYLNDE